jgi:nicotinamide riboside kinase
MLSGKILSPTSDQSIYPPANTGHITVEDGGKNLSRARVPLIDTAVIEEQAFDEITQNRDQSLIAETQRGPNAEN